MAVTRPAVWVTLVLLCCLTAATAQSNCAPLLESLTSCETAESDFKTQLETCNASNKNMSLALHEMGLLMNGTLEGQSETLIQLIEEQNATINEMNITLAETKQLWEDDLAQQELKCSARLEETKEQCEEEVAAHSHSLSEAESKNRKLISENDMLKGAYGKAKKVIFDTKSNCHLSFAHVTFAELRLDMKFEPTTFYLKSPKGC